MAKFHFISSLRTHDIEGIPGGFKNYQYETEDEGIAEKLRKVRGINEVRREADKLVPVADAPAHVAAETKTKIELAEERQTQVVAGTRYSTTKTSKKEKLKP